MSATDRLQRILYILAVSSRPGGERLDELATALGVDIPTIISDIQEVTAREFYHPAGSTDAFTILLDKGRIRVEAAKEFRRPTRLTPIEALALGLGLRILAADHDERRRSEILDLAERLEEKLRAPEYAMRPRSTRTADQSHTHHANTRDHGTMFEFGEDDARATLADAARASRVCTLSYVRPGAAELSERRIVPRRLLYGSGRWYVAAWDLDRSAPRTFRLDRIIGIDVHEQHVTPPESDDMIEQIVRQGMVYVNEDEETTRVRVRYSSRIARWVAEHVSADLEADGSLVLTHDVSDPRWLIRHVLQYGGDAIVETGPLRSAIARAAARVSTPA